MVLRIALPFEIAHAKNILLPEVLPLINTIVRYPLIELSGFKITTWLIMIAIWVSMAIYKIRIMIHDYSVIKKSLLVLSDLSKSRLHIAKLVEAEMSLRRKIIYKISNTYSSPFIFGLIEPIIVLPSVIENFSDNELRMILNHELNHHKKKDCISKIILESFSCIFWWFPFIKHITDKMDEATEMRADWNVVKNMTEDQKTEYLTTLYRVSRVAVEAKNNILFSNMFTSGQVSTTEKRFRFIISFKKWRYTNLMRVAVIVLFAVSYIIVIEPRYNPNDAISASMKTCYVYTLQGDKYAVYMGKDLFGVMNDISFLKDSSLKNMKVKIITGGS